MQVWNHDAALERLVHVIRKIQPLIVITNHDPDGIDHGHHRAAGKLLVEAFDAAADPKQFPKQIEIEQLKAWQISTIYLRHFAPTESTFSVDVSVRDKLSGMSASEIGAFALAQHTSQGMLRTLKTGERELRFFSVLKTSLPDAVNWKQMGLLSGLNAELHVADSAREYANELLKPGAKNLAAFIADKNMPAQQRAHLNRAVAEALGLKFEAVGADAFIVPGEKVKITLRAANTGVDKVTLSKISFSTRSPGWRADALTPGLELPGHSAENVETEISAGAEVPIDYPADAFLFSQETRTAAVTAQAEFTVELGEQKIKLTLDADVPLRVAPPVSFAVVPPSLVLFGDPAANADTDEVVQIKLLGTANARLAAPIFVAAKAGPKPKPGEDGLVMTLASKGSSALWNLRQLVSVEQLARGPVELSLHAWDAQNFYTVPSVTVQRVPLELPVNMRVGLVKGVDDQTYHALKLMQDSGVGRGTFSVSLLSDKELRAGDLNKYQALVLDIRATQQRPVVRAVKERLREFMNHGGTVLCFYQKDFDWNEHGKGLSERGAGFFRGTGGGGELAPFPIEVSFERVTREDAPVRILNPEHALLLKPCRIWQKDFEGWVQERGAYFPKQWAAEYTPLLSCNDPGEKPLDGGLLVADVGRGAFIYTSYFLHRQLRANVPGAYRLLANMLSYSRMKR